MRLRIIDATCASKPGSKGTDFRLHVNVELPDRRFTEAELTDERGGEGFDRFSVRPGDLMVADRAYGTTEGVACVVRAGGDVLVRITASSLPLWSKDGTRLDPLVVARALDPEQTVDVRAEIRPLTGDPIAGRLCIYAVPLDKAIEAQQRVRRKTKRKHNKSPGPVAIESAKYVMLFTTASATQMTAAQACATYRLRWQIELAFKTLKTVLKLDELPNRLPGTGRTWLLAKLVCALLIDRLSQRATAFFPSELAA